jgi:hypothetical protein
MKPKNKSRDLDIQLDIKIKIRECRILEDRVKQSIIRLVSDAMWNSITVIYFDDECEHKVMKDLNETKKYQK